MVLSCSSSALVPAVAVMSALLCRCRGLALIASFAFLAAALILMKGMLDVCDGAILSLGHLFEGLEHLVSDAILPG